MKVKIVFKLPEEEQEHRLAMNGERLFGAIWDYSQYLREITRRSSKGMISREEVTDRFYEILGNKGINLDDYR